MALVNFLRGTGEGLKGKQLQDGNLYFVKDENTLYFDIQNGENLERRRLSNYVEFATVEAMQSTLSSPKGMNPQEGVLYLAKDTNVLYYYDPKNINDDGDVEPVLKALGAEDIDAIISKAEHVVAVPAADNGKTTTISLKLYGSNKTVTSTISLASADENTLLFATDDTGVLTARVANIAESVKVGVATTDDGVSVALSTVKNGTGANGAAVTDQLVASTAFSMVGGDGITLDIDSQKIVVTGNEITKVTNAFNEEGALTTTIAQSNPAEDSLATVTGSITPVLAYGKYSATSATAKFLSGTAELDVYTSAEVDKKLQAVNAMHFSGNITEGTANKSGLSVGDTFVVADTFEIDNATSPLPEGVYRPGDLVIATGEEGEDGLIKDGTLQYVHVESGNEAGLTLGTDTSAQAFKIYQDGATIGNLAASNGLVASASTSDGKSEWIVQHATGAALATSTKTAAKIDFTDEKGSAEVTVITAIAKDAYNHITGYETQTININDTHNALESAAFSVSATSAVGNVKIRIADTDGNEALTSSFNLASDTLVVSTAADNTLNMNIMWQDF